MRRCRWLLVVGTLALGACGGSGAHGAPTILSGSPDFGAVAHAHGDTWSFHVFASDGAAPPRLYGQLFAKSPTRQTLLSQTELAILGADEYEGGFQGTYCTLLDNYSTTPGPIEIDVYVADEDLGMGFDPSNAPATLTGHVDTRSWMLTCQ